MPRMKMTPMVKMALYALRIYLILLLTLILVSFIRMTRSNRAATGEPAVTMPTQASSAAVTQPSAIWPDR